MLEKLRPWFKRLINPVAKGMVKIGLTANAVTVIGAIGTTIVGIATGITGWLFWGALAMTLLVIFDSLDGSVAKLTNGGTHFGAFLDSTLDRVADWAVLLGVIIYFFMRNCTALLVESRYDVVALVGMGAAIYAIMTSFVTSYIRARAESVGAEAKGGIATRSDRLTIILVGMAISGLTHQDAWLMATMCVLALLGTITVGQRIHEARISIEATLDDANKG
ncbi:CDP-diacylglycerol--glycerol-3-phosphate 3-phosphatidyltransferase [Bifidobacterium anseris]|uniref:Phosphatidylinositol phosphate synthase n=1 Tax=Bifidobacterium anseris TaxID=2020963 RepID=A0A2N5J1Y2_9BIFI|nr:MULTISPECIES: CDP-alcohol phosphatidyltransferase family protein [Bifidobacterium]PLS28207.1 CDP-diacylglycerol--glycerol-3-phosphate 3-phosphatidyltransferase [Bifidobacterium anseris]